MSQVDMRRFVASLRHDPVLAIEVKAQSGLDDVLAVARRNGFAITPACVIAYLVDLATVPPAHSRAVADENHGVLH